MPLNYNQNDRLSIVLTAQDTHIQLYSKIMHWACAKEEALKPRKLPRVFPSDQEIEKFLGLMAETSLNSLKGKSQVFINKAAALLEELDSHDTEKKTQELQKLSVLFENFMTELKLLRERVFHDDRGLDLLSGLKNKTAMQNDLRLEMERLARQGSAFSLAVASIDDFEEIENNFSADEVEKFINIASKVVKNSLRSFDEAYYIGKNEFVFCMKQADLPGGIRAFERFEEELEHADTEYKIEGKRKN